MPRDKPEVWVGQKCKVFWPDDTEWYDATVRAYDRSNGKHNVWYSYDQQVSWLLLVQSAVQPISCVSCMWKVECAGSLIVCKYRADICVQKRLLDLMCFWPHRPIPTGFAATVTHIETRLAGL